MRQEWYRRNCPQCTFPALCHYWNAAMDCASVCGEYIGSGSLGIIRIRSRWPPEPLPGPVFFSQVSTPTGLCRLGRLPGSSRKKLSMALPKTAERLAANKARPPLVRARYRRPAPQRRAAAVLHRPFGPLGAWPSGTERRGRSPVGRWNKPWVPPPPPRGSSRLPPYSPPGRALCRLSPPSRPSRSAAEWE